MIGLIERPTYQLYRHFLWADLVEILASVNIDQSCSKSAFIDRLFATKKDIDNSVLEDLEGDSLPSESSEDTVKSKHGRENFINDVFAILEHRVKLYGAKYPFKIENEVLYSRLDNEYALPYTYLLLCSHTRVVKDLEKRSLLTSDFELLSHQVLKRYLGERATVHIFGAGSSRDTLFEEKTTKTLREKFKKLSDEFCGKFIAEPNDNSLDQTSGDRGLDLVANFKFSDKLNSGLVIYGQCKCSDEWSEKLFEASDDSINEILKFKSKPISVMFMPFCFRGADGNWAESSLVRSSILFDRFRILEFINFDIAPVLVKSHDFLNEFLKFTEPVV